MKLVKAEINDVVSFVMDVLFGFLQKSSVTPEVKTFNKILDYVKYFFLIHFFFF